MLFNSCLFKNSPLLTYKILKWLLSMLLIVSRLTQNLLDDDTDSFYFYHSNNFLRRCLDHSFNSWFSVPAWWFGEQSYWFNFANSSYFAVDFLHPMDICWQFKSSIRKNDWILRYKNLIMTLLKIAFFTPDWRRK